MVEIPQDGDAPLIRCDFSNMAAWERLVAATKEPSPDGFVPNLQIIDNDRYDGASANQIGSAARDTNHAVVFIADEITMGNDDLSVLCLNVSATEQRFRVIPSELWGVENNLSLGNMDFEEFADATGADGIFRGF
ncbi:DUF6924 domain-containing protein [Porphyrobacter sp. ULC335]|jgi:hypothetical protein|uniref:DUF6924 domain-containing protein n=1 Tax=Porphyrobacter sp. ULC335 TaxID=2854260 RepID=UPI002220C3D8|nr:hypothetical protein [Porphyrobacter sp. ULC335]UYV16786.1 hypothetical protein KVF90_05630 [Porphyrobacter sp. ULC335]